MKFSPTHQLALQLIMVDFVAEFVERRVQKSKSKKDKALEMKKGQISPVPLTRNTSGETNKERISLVPLTRNISGETNKERISLVPLTRNISGEKKLKKIEYHQIN